MSYSWYYYIIFRHYIVNGRLRLIILKSINSQTDYNTHINRLNIHKSHYLVVEATYVKKLFQSVFNCSCSTSCLSVNVFLQFFVQIFSFFHFILEFLFTCFCLKMHRMYKIVSRHIHLHAIISYLQWKLTNSIFIQ